MYLNSQHVRALLFFAIALMACGGPVSESTTGQRAISQATIEALDVQMDITSGTFRQATSDSVWARAAGPVARFRVAGGPQAAGTLPITVSNLHPQAAVTLLSVDYLDDAALSGCPNVTRRASIPCAAARAAIDTPCAAQSDCVAGLSCTAGFCTATPDLDVCVDMASSRSPEDATALSFDVDLVRCTAFQFGFELAGADEVRFGVVGPTSSLGRLEAAVTRLKAEEVDFVAILGENLESASTAGLESMDTRLSRLGVSIVYVVGEDADDVDSGQAALKMLGPHDHIFSLHGSRFVVFYSANRTLATNGLVRLESFLRALAAQRDAAGTGVVMALTHTPPLDPNGTRDLGFKSRTEGARVMSMLNRFGVTDLFAGRVPASDHAVFGEVDVWLTGSSDGLLRSVNEALLVTSKNVPDGEVSVRRLDL